MSRDADRSSPAPPADPGSAVTRRAFIIACGLTTAGCAVAAPPATRSATAGDPYRLPSTVVPRRYELRIAPDFTAKLFSGRTVNEVAIREPVSEIALNAAELTIFEASISSDADFVIAHSISLGGNVVERELERLRIVVALREREATALRAYLRRSSARPIRRSQSAEQVA